MEKKGMNAGWAPALRQVQMFPLPSDLHTHTHPSPATRGAAWCHPLA